MKIEEIKPGDILLYRTNKFISKAIQAFEKCKWSHASIAFEVWGNIMVAEADNIGLVPNTIQDSIKGCEILVLRPKYETDPSKLGKLIIPSLGKHRYNYFKLIIVQAIWQIFHKWILDESKSEKLKRVICGEYVAWVVYQYYDGKYFDNWYRVAPKDIFESDLYDHYVLELPQTK